MNGVVVLMVPFIAVLVFGLGWLAMADGIADRINHDTRHMRESSQGNDKKDA